MSNELYHHGIKGQRWGVRRYQNQDGTLTAAGKKRYSSGANGDITKWKPKNDEDPDKLYEDVKESDSKLGKTSEYQKIDKKIEEATTKVADDPKYYSKKGWKTKMAFDKYSQAQTDADNANGLSKVSKDIAAKLAFEKYLNASDREIYNRTSFEISKYYDKKRMNAVNKAITKYVDEKAGMILRDLGYDDTEKGRKIVARMI